MFAVSPFNQEIGSSNSLQMTKIRSWNEIQLEHMYKIIFCFKKEVDNFLTLRISCTSVCILFIVCVEKVSSLGRLLKQHTMFKKERRSRKGKTTNYLSHDLSDLI